MECLISTANLPPAVFSSTSSPKIRAEGGGTPGMWPHLMTRLSKGVLLKEAKEGFLRLDSSAS